VDLPLVQVGYKAMRRVLLDELEYSIAHCQFIILGGRTGTGKTWLLKKLEHTIDLEALAHHRGSSFGRFPDGQPSQITFENNLSIQLMKYRAKGVQQCWLEDEGRMIGRLALPLSLQNKMKYSPLVIVEEELDYRINITLKDYVIDLEKYYQSYDQQTNSKEDMFNLFSEYLLTSLTRIQKRLGGERYQYIYQQLQTALIEHKKSGNIDLHRLWIESLLTLYYDPMYDYQLSKKPNRVLFRGNSQIILADQKKYFNESLDSI
jgi:tRNA 2-selenouridine synthase